MALNSEFSALQELAGDDWWGCFAVFYTFDSHETRTQGNGVIAIIKTSCPRINCTATCCRAPQLTKSKTKLPFIGSNPVLYLHIFGRALPGGIWLGLNHIRTRLLALRMARKIAKGVIWIIQVIEDWCAKQCLLKHLPDWARLKWLTCFRSSCISQFPHENASSKGHQESLAINLLTKYSNEYRQRDRETGAQLSQRSSNSVGIRFSQICMSYES